MDSFAIFLVIAAIVYWLVYGFYRLTRHPAEPLSTVIEPAIPVLPSNYQLRPPIERPPAARAAPQSQRRDYEVEPRRLAIVAAVKNQWLLSITYEDEQGQLSSRDVLPYEVQHRGSRYMLFGHCSLRNEARHFRLDRIRELNVHASREATREKYRCAG